MNKPPDSSPEEKLLQLIKNKKPALPQADPVKPAGNVENKSPGRPLPAAPGFAESRAGKSFSLKSGGKPDKLNFTLLNIVLGLACLGLIAYLLVDFFFLEKSYNEKLAKVKTAVGRDEYKAIMEAIKPPAPYSGYSSRFSGKDLFKAQVVVEAKKSGIPKKEVREMIKNLSLMGIISEDDPQAIIEDKASRKSYTLSRGEYISGMEIVEIKNNKIVLEYEGQRFDLYL